MNWKKIISDLVAAKLTQKEIAKRIGVTQSAISQILSGKKSAQKGFRYEPGQRLIALYKSYGGDNHLIRPELATASAPPSRPTPKRCSSAARNLAQKRFRKLNRMSDLRAMRFPQQARNWK